MFSWLISVRQNSLHSSRNILCHLVFVSWFLNSPFKNICNNFSCMQVWESWSHYIMKCWDVTVKELWKPVKRCHMACKCICHSFVLLLHCISLHETITSNSEFSMLFWCKVWKIGKCKLLGTLLKLRLFVCLFLKEKKKKREPLPCSLILKHCKTEYQPTLTQQYVLISSKFHLFFVNMTLNRFCLLYRW